MTMKTYSNIINEDALADLRRRRDNLSVKISDWKKKGKDVSSLQAELAQIKADIAAQRNAGGTTSPAAKATASSAQPKAKTKDWQEGYDAAIEAIKKAMSGQGQSGGSGGPDAMSIPMDPSQQQGGSGSGSGDQSGQSGSGSGSGGSDSGQSRGSGSEGVVRPEDCISPADLSNIPDTSGAMMDKAIGDLIAQAEGYEKEGGSTDSIQRDWQEKAEQVAQKMRGKGAGWDKFAAKVFDAKHASKNWKKEFIKIVGRSISEDDKRRGYTNNNVLISQDRISLTDKQKFDAMDVLLICLDTSGSFMGDDVRKAINDAAHIAMAKKPMRIVIVQWDTRVADVQEFISYQKLIQFINKGKFEVKGGGGTTAGCIWEWLRRDKKYSRIRPELTVIFTDGYIESPVPKRDSRRMQSLCWVIIDNPNFQAPKDQSTFTVHVKTK